MSTESWEVQQRLHGADEFEPSWIEHSFTAWAQCSNAKCKQTFAIGGKGGVEPQYMDDEGNWDYVEYFTPLFCFPMPQIVEIPRKCPEDVAEELKTAFSLFWSSPTSCAGRIRVALELLMDGIGVPKRKKAPNGKYTDLTLHGRIEIYALKDSVLGGQLMALKWLGNSGSHVGAVSHSDLLDAFEILEHALREIVDRRTARVAELTKKLLKKHSSRK